MTEIWGGSYQDEPVRSPMGMNVTEMTTVYDSRLPRQRDDRAAIRVLAELIEHHTQNPLERAEMARRRRADTEATIVHLDAIRRWDEQV